MSYLQAKFGFKTLDFEQSVPEILCATGKVQDEKYGKKRGFVVCRPIGVASRIRVFVSHARKRKEESCNV